MNMFIHLLELLLLYLSADNYNVVWANTEHKLHWNSLEKWQSFVLTRNRPYPIRTQIINQRNQNSEEQSGVKTKVYHLSNNAVS